MRLDRFFWGALLGWGVFAAPLWAQLTADFSFSPGQPAVGQQIQFTDQSTGGPEQWSWDFGDGQTATDRNPRHSYSLAGSYQVALTVSKISGAVQIKDTATKTITVGSSCSYSVSPSTLAVGSAGGQQQVSVTASCSWSATSGVAWIDLQEPSSGGGSATLRFDVEANADSQRSGQVTVSGAGGQAKVTVRQSAPGTTCSYSLQPTQVSVPVGGRTGSVQIVTESGCSWTAQSSASWLRIDSASSGTGSATLDYTVLENTGAARQASLSVADQTFLVRQAGLSTGCSSSISLNEALFGSWSSQCASTHRVPGYYAHFYDFSLPTPTQVVIDLVSEEDAYLYLLSGSSTGSVIVENDDGGIGFNSRIEATLPAGSYTLEATTYDPGITGDFEIALSESCLLPLDPNGVEGVWSPGCRAAHRDSPGKFYTTELEYASRVRIDLWSPDTDAYLYLLSGSGTEGNVVAFDDDSGDELNARIERSLEAGSYTVEATTYDPVDTGTFTLGWSSCVEGIRPGGIRTGDWIEPCTSSHRGSSYQARYFVFELTGTTELEIDLRSDERDTYLYLLGGEGPDGEVIAEDDDGGEGTNSYLERELGPGTYTVEVTTFDPVEFGEFEVRLSGCTSSIDLGESIAGSWQGACDSVTWEWATAAYYSFTLNESTEVRIDLEAAGGDSYLVLYAGSGPGGTFVAEDDDGGTGLDSRIRRTLAPGTYTIEATHLDWWTTGAYVLSMNDLTRPPGICTADVDTMCLNDERFAVEVFWADFAGNLGSGSLVPFGSDDSGLFWFFSDQNWEMLVKVLDGCGFNQHYWVFAAATTNVEYILRVTDRDTGLSTSYANPLGDAADAITDTAALGCSAGPGATGEVKQRRALAPRTASDPAPRQSCSPTSQALCLNQSRFRVEVEWRDFENRTGSARVVPFGSDDSGLFWFFSDQNWEMLVKVLDGCPITDHYWVFAAATTNVEYTLRVTDTESGVQTEYFNPLGTAAPALTDTEALSVCP